MKKMCGESPVMTQPTPNPVAQQPVMQANPVIPQQPIMQPGVGVTNYTPPAPQNQNFIPPVAQQPVMQAPVVENMYLQHLEQHQQLLLLYPQHLVQHQHQLVNLYHYLQHLVPYLLPFVQHQLPF